ncbi:MAG: PAS domain S-box protein [Acidobacteriota bacterium]
MPFHDPRTERPDAAFLLGHVQQAIAATDLDGGITFWNPHSEQLYGWSAQEVAGRKLLDTDPSQSLLSRGSEIVTALRTGRTWTGDCELPHRDGSLVQIHATAAALLTDDGAMTGMVVITTGTAKLNAAEERARIANELLLSALRASRDAVVLFRFSDETIIEVNDAWLEVTGLTRETAIGRKQGDLNVWRTTDEDNRFREEMAEKGFAGDFEFEFTGRSGEIGRALLSAETILIGGEAYVLAVGHDVTARLQAQSALLESEEKYRSLFENSLDAVLLSTPEHEILAANPAAVHMTGWSVEELRQRGAESLLPPEELQKSIGELESNGRFRGYQNLRRSDGSSFVGEVTISRFRDGRGALRSTVVIRDVTESVRSRESLEQAETKFRTLVENALIGVYIIQRARLVYCNPELTRMLGSSEAALLALTSVLDLVAGEDRERLAATMTMAAESGRPHREIFRVHRGDGEVVEIEVHGAAIDYEGAPAILGSAVDVTEQRRSEAALRRSEMRYRTLVEEAQDIIFTCDLEGRITSLNHAFEETTGWRVSDWLGRTFMDLIQPEFLPQTVSHFEEILAGGQASRESILRCADGSTIVVEGTARPLMIDGQAVGTLGITRDVTERRRMEAALERSGRFTALGRLAATLAHEFNNVLMGIQSVVDMLQRISVPQEVQAHVASIRGSVQRGRRITQDVLRFTRVADPELEPVDLDELVTHLASDFLALTGPTITVVVEADRRRRLRVMADPHQLQQVFINVILNARDAMPAGGRITVSVEEQLSRSGDPAGVAAVVFEDTGTGMSPETVALMFEPLFTTKKSSGTGLGLAIVHQIVERHHGVVEVESELGRGTRIEILLPIHTGTEQAAQSTQPMTNHRPRRLLLVEDDLIVAAGLAAVLELEGVAVDVVNLGGEAEGAIDRSMPEAVVLDLNLPDMDGRQVYEVIARRWPQLPVIISSGHGDEVSLREFLAGANTAFLLKPYDIETLFATLAKIMGSR